MQADKVEQDLLGFVPVFRLAVVIGLLLAVAAPAWSGSPGRIRRGPPPADLAAWRTPASSHTSIIAKSLFMPAVIGVPKLTRIVDTPDAYALLPDATGDWLQVCSMTGVRPEMLGRRLPLLPAVREMRAKVAALSARLLRPGSTRQRRLGQAADCLLERRVEPHPFAQLQVMNEEFRIDQPPAHQLDVERTLRRLGGKNVGAHLKNVGLQLLRIASSAQRLINDGAKLLLGFFGCRLSLGLSCPEVVDGAPHRVKDRAADGRHGGRPGPGAGRDCEPRPRGR